MSSATSNCAHISFFFLSLTTVLVFVDADDSRQWSRQTRIDINRGKTRDQFAQCDFYPGGRVECQGRLRCQPTSVPSQFDAATIGTATLDQICPGENETASGTYSADQGILPAAYYDGTAAQKVTVCIFKLPGYFFCQDTTDAEYDQRPSWSGEFSGRLSSAFQLNLPPMPVVPRQDDLEETVTELSVPVTTGPILLLFTITPYPLYVCEYYQNGQVGCRDCTENILRARVLLPSGKYGTRRDYTCVQPVGGPIRKSWRADNGVIPMIPNPQGDESKVVATCIFDTTSESYECHGDTTFCAGPNTDDATKCLAGERWTGQFTGNFGYLSA